jgi:hypothetical protein
MNLVAKEYVAAQDPDDPGVLILSCFAGAAEQLVDALLVNPHSPEEMADAIATAKAMPPTFWVYGGSEFYDGKFVPETTGDISAIYVTNSSLINYPGDDNFNDEVWSSFTDRIPDLDTKVTLVIAPYKEKP